ncbi:unnamed protein product, partial [Allacma fusca]
YRSNAEFALLMRHFPALVAFVPLDHLRPYYEIKTHIVNQDY